MKHTTFKRTLAGLLAILTVAAYLPANVGTGGGLTGSKTIVANADEITPTTIKTEAELKNAFKNGGNYQLSNDINFTSDNLVVGDTKNVTLDLHGYNINLGSNRLIVGNNANDATVDGKAILSITNSSAEAMGTISTSGQSNVCNYCELTIGANVKLTSTAGYTIYYKKYSTLTVAGTVENKNATDGIAIGGNGNPETNGTTYNSCSIGATLNIQDGASITSDTNEAIYHPHNGTLNMTGGTVTGKSAIIARAGTLNISGGILEGTGDAATIGTVPNGANATGDAIVIQSFTDSYQGNPILKITGGTNAGSYTVRAKIAEKDLYWDETATADFTIAKADPNVTAPTGKSLTYTGSVQTLITEGKATNGTMYYYLGSTAPATDSASWTTTAPTATSSGTYKIWYYVKGNNANYNNVAPVSVTATISSPVVSSKSSQNFTISLPSYTYDGTAHEVTISGTTYGKVITYYYDSDGHSLDEAPSEPGDYTVRVYASGNSSYYSKSVSAEYTISEPETEKYSVSVKNGTVDGKTTAEVEADTVIAVKADKAPAGYKFGYWKKDGSDRAISYNANYTFKVISDIELEAVYLEDSDDVERYGYSVKDSVEIDKTSKAISFIFMNNVPEDCTIVKCGIVATSDASKAEALALGNADYDRYKTTDKHNFRYTWKKTGVTASQTWYVKGYLIYKTADGIEKTVYSDLEKATLEGSETIKEEKIVGTTIMTSVKSYKHQDTSKGNAIDFVSLSSVPADCTILKAGVVATSNATKAKNLTDANADYVRFMETTKHNAQYTWTKTKVTSSQTWYVKPYLVYKDADGTQYTVYGDLTTKKWS